MTNDPQNQRRNVPPQNAWGPRQPQPPQWQPQPPQYPPQYFPPPPKPSAWRTIGILISVIAAIVIIVTVIIVVVAIVLVSGHHPATG